jgi:DNA invertase Pin-like site-specific DNA recombinase
MLVGYARISDKTQKVDSQVDVLEKAGCERIVEETITGISTKKTKLYHLLKELQEGDTLVVTRADRLARRTVQILEVSETLNNKGVNLVILDLGIDTRTPAGKMVLTIMASVAEWERDQLKEKQRRGIEAARKRGVHLGREKNYNDESMEEALQAHKEGKKTVAEICRIYNVSRATLYRRINERKLNSL